MRNTQYLCCVISICVIIAHSVELCSKFSQFRLGHQRCWHQRLRLELNLHPRTSSSRVFRRLPFPCRRALPFRRKQHHQGGVQSLSRRLGYTRNLYQHWPMAGRDRNFIPRRNGTSPSASSIFCATTLLRPCIANPSASD